MTRKTSEAGSNSSVKGEDAVSYEDTYGKASEMTLRKGFSKYWEKIIH